MNRNHRNAYNALRKIGAPVFINADHEAAGNFGISGEPAGRDGWGYPEEKNTAPDGRQWASYYTEDYREEWSRFGVHNAINDILDRYGLYCEWYDCGSLNVYEA